MSWTDYVSNLEQGPCRAKYAALFGKDGGKWAESNDKSLLPVKDEQITAVIESIKSQDTNVQGNGVTLGGVRFTCILMEPDLLVLSGKGDYKEYSLVFAMAEKCCVVGFNPEADIKLPAVRTAVEGLRDYLKGAGY